MMGWSHLSSNPCTVLVKEKQDRDSQHSNSVDCSPSIQSSTNRPMDSSHHTKNQQLDHQQDSGTLGNSIGGKETRIKREVFDTFEHDDARYEDLIHEIFETIEKRILVNITIGMDKGLGTQRHDIYQLQVAVPLKAKQKTENQEFYAYNVHENDENVKETTETVHDVGSGDGNDDNVASTVTESSRITEMETDYSTHAIDCDCNGRNNTSFFDNGGLNALEQINLINFQKKH